MKKHLIKILSIVFFIMQTALYAQTIIVTDDSTYTTGNSSSVLDIKSTTKGLLLPRMTKAQRLAISSPAEGLIVFQTDNDEGLYCYTKMSGSLMWVSLPCRTNHVMIRSLGDFPAPSAGVITLADSTTYELNGLINIGANTLNMGNATVIYGINKLADGLTTSGTGNIITSTNTAFVLKDFTINAPNTSGVINITQNSSNETTIRDIDFDDCNILGTITGGGHITFDGCDMHDGITNGLVIQGTVTAFLFIHNEITGMAAGTCLNIASGTFKIIGITANTFYVTTGVTAINISNSLTLSNGMLQTCFFSGTGSYLSGITTTDINWSIRGNTGLADGTANGFVRFKNNATVTTISAANTYYKASGTNNYFIGERCDNGSTNNRIHYIGKKTFTGKFLVTCSVQPANTGNDIVIAVYKNGTTNIEETDTKGVGATFNVAINGEVSLSTGDYLEIFIMNQSASSNVTIQDMQFKLSE